MYNHELSVNISSLYRIIKSLSSENTVTSTLDSIHLLRDEGFISKEQREALISYVMSVC